MRFNNGKVLFLGDKELVGFLDIAKTKGFQVV